MEKVKEYLKTKQNLCKTVKEVFEVDAEASIYTLTDAMLTGKAFLYIYVVSDIISLERLYEIATNYGYVEEAAELQISEFDIDLASKLEMSKAKEITQILKEIIYGDI